MGGGKISENPSAKLILIIKNNVQAMKSVESFLTNRGWRFHTTHQTREALDFIIQKRPRYILLSSDHPNKKTKTLPKVIQQAFPECTVIGFTENKSNAGIASVLELELVYNLYPPVSGPAIDRMLLKVQRESEEKAKAEKNIKTSLSKQHIEASVMQSSIESARATLQSLIQNSEDDSSAGDKGSSTKTKESGPIIQKGVIGESIFHNPNTNSQESGDSVQQEPDEQSVPYQRPATDGQSSSSSIIYTKDSKKNDIFTGQPSDQDASSIPNPNSESQAEKNNSVALGPKDPTTNTFFTKTEDSIIVRGTQTALDEAIRISGKKLNDVGPLNTVSNLACITIKSAHFSGYLVAAFGENKKIEADFIDFVKDRLFTFLRNHGEPIDEEETLNVEIVQVEFEDWALAQAEFLKKSIHGANEIAMAFFPTDDTKIVLEKSAEENMLQMKFEDLQGDSKMEFDLYIHMPINKKYLLYTPEGQNFASSQKERLKKKGVTHMHLRKEKITDVKRYKVKNFLNNKIEKFKKLKLNS